MRTQKEVFERILNTVNGEPVSFMRLCRQCGFNYRTMRRSLELIEYLQREQNKLEIMRDGFRVVIKRPDSPPNHAPSV
jgi:predicted transcriptional regulator